MELLQTLDGTLLSEGLDDEAIETADTLTAFLVVLHDSSQPSRPLEQVASALALSASHDGCSVLCLFSLLGRTLVVAAGS